MNSVSRTWNRFLFPILLEGVQRWLQNELTAVFQSILPPQVVHAIIPFLSENEDVLRVGSVMMIMMMAMCCFRDASFESSSNRKRSKQRNNYWIQSSCIYEFTGGRSTHFASAEPFVFCAAVKKESIHNMKPAASSSTFATFYAVSSPPGRFNLGGPVSSSD
jgi:hypothetical protein